MNRESQTISLLESARLAGEAIEAHAYSCVDKGGTFIDVIHRGEALVSAVQEYEQRLRDLGWSNPLRHLGPQHIYVDEVSRLPAGNDESQCASTVEVKAKYIVAVCDVEQLFNLVEGRGGERPADIVGAIRFLYEADGWDAPYPPDRVYLEGASVDISVKD